MYVDSREDVDFRCLIILVNDLCDPPESMVPGRLNMMSISLSISAVCVTSLGRDVAGLADTCSIKTLPVLSFNCAITADRREKLGSNILFSKCNLSRFNR